MSSRIRYETLFTCAIRRTITCVQYIFAIFLYKQTIRNLCLFLFINIVFYIKVNTMIKNTANFYSPLLYEVVFSHKSILCECVCRILCLSFITFKTCLLITNFCYFRSLTFFRNIKFGYENMRKWEIPKNIQRTLPTRAFFLFIQIMMLAEINCV